ncbi:phosphatase PAP2 family protein [Bradyrhizobium sp.]|uniref:phosphatase PAP2 family protein n=1 Tax=Bradyrhizobium sp. TaxID=376 RepID=UPI003C540023
MPTSSVAVESQGYVPQSLALIGGSAGVLLRPPSAPRRVEAAGRLKRQTLWLTVIGAVVVAALMAGFDATEIGLMPPRGTPGLWPVRIITDFGKDGYVLEALAAILIAIALIGPALRGAPRRRLLRFGTQTQYLFLAVLLPVLVAEIVKWVVGRGRPFVGGKANVFNFMPFNGTEAHFSFPSAHAVTSFALAFAIAALWPRTRIAVAIYALLIGGSRLLLLAHHPSDVVAGALIGVIGAMVVRHWFAVRRLGFAIHDDGKIVPR